MRLFLKIVSYISHPIFTPIFGTLLYFYITPKYNNNLIILYTSILPIITITVITPILSYYILKNTGKISSIFVPNIKERKYPFYINITLLFVVLLKVIPYNYNAEVYFFFLGLILAYLTSLLLLFFNIKSSMHLMSIGSLLMLVINLSIHFKTNIIILISTLILLTGLIASSRLYLKAHIKSELIIGLFIGILSQLLTIRFWL